MIRRPLLIALVLTLVAVTSILAAAMGTIVGVVREAETGKTLPGANVHLEGTAIGAASNQDGEFRLTNIPPGRYTLVVSYLGYGKVRIPIEIKGDETIRKEVQLESTVLEGEGIVVTAQMQGQAAAINQQLSSNTIVNVVSADRIQELPDANAAESVGRLPGISITRSGGEGNKVVIRGLAPTYNSVTIGGERIPATDLDDRSVDMSMISPEILAAIEVTKALTPDKDADAFGGTVNFKLTDAPDGGFRYNFRLQGGYNRQREEPGQYKGSATLSNRFFDGKLGLLVTGNLERAQRGSDQFNAGYEVIREKREGEEFAPISITGVNLEYGNDVRRRSGFNVLLDYQMENSKIMFTNFMSRLDRDEITTIDRYSEDSNTHERRFRNRQQQIDILSNSLAGEHRLNFGTLDWRVSRNSALTRHPYDNLIRIRETGAFDRSKLGESFGPEQFVNSAYNDLTKTGLYEGYFYTEKSFERDYTTQLNLQVPYSITSNVAGFIKLGGKYVQKLKERDRGYRSARLDNLNYNYAAHHSKYGTPGFVYEKMPSTGWGAISNYIDRDFKAPNFLGGAFKFDIGLDADELNYFLKTFLLDSVYRISSLADLDDYETTERVAAGYIMAEINIGQVIMLLPGVRYEHTGVTMTGREGIVPAIDDEPELDKPFISDTSATASYGKWFPMVQLRVRPTGWFDIRLAYTKSLSRPRLDWMLPKRKVYGSEQTVEFGRPDLKPQIATNYDAFLSFFGDKLGLVTIGGFYKQIDDLIFNRAGHKILNAEKEGFTPDLQGLTLSRPENNPFKTTVRGYEVEWQTNLRWLPSPFDGVVLNANYSHIWSETNFPRSFVKQERLPVFPFIRTTVVDTFRVSSMPDQASDIMSIALGYDKGPFSARLSMMFQGRTLSFVGERPELDGYTDDLLRWDLSVKYRLLPGVGLFFNWNNISNEPDESFQRATHFPTSREFYNWTMDVGIGYSF